eukprot:ctg_335.g123
MLASFRSSDAGDVRAGRRPALPPRSRFGPLAAPFPLASCAPRFRHGQRGTDFRPQENRSGGGALQTGPRPDQSERVPAEPGAAGAAARQGVRAAPLAGRGQVRRGGHSSARARWRVHLADLRHTAGDLQGHRRLLPK